MTGEGRKGPEGGRCEGSSCVMFLDGRVYMMSLWDGVGREDPQEAVEGLAFSGKVGVRCLLKLGGSSAL